MFKTLPGSNQSIKIFLLCYETSPFTTLYSFYKGFFGRCQDFFKTYKCPAEKNGGALRLAISNH